MEKLKNAVADSFKVNSGCGLYAFILLRLAMGWTFLWPFLDKLFGLGFSTTPDKSWLAGVSPTSGFLSFATHGPFASLFHSMAGSAFVDWLFMLGLLLIGLALISGVGMRIACFSGVLLLSLMWLSRIPPEQNPFLDEHIIYILVLLVLFSVRAGRWFGLGKWWAGTDLVKKCPVLE